MADYHITETFSPKRSVSKIFWKKMVILSLSKYAADPILQQSIKESTKRLQYDHSYPIGRSLPLIESQRSANLPR